MAEDNIPMSQGLFTHRAETSQNGDLPFQRNSRVRAESFYL